MKKRLLKVVSIPFALTIGVFICIPAVTIAWIITGKYHPLNDMVIDYFNWLES